MSESESLVFVSENMSTHFVERKSPDLPVQTILPISSAKKSRIWNHSRIIDEGGISYVQCYYCDKGHLIAKHGELVQDVITTNHCEDEFRKDLLHWIVCDTQPHMSVESPHFRKIVKETPPCRNWVKTEILASFEREKQKLILELENVSKLALSLDCWTSSNSKSFLCINAHFLSDDFTLQQKTLDFRPLPGKHTGEALARTLWNTLNSFNIVDKISAISLDNAANNNKMFLELALMSDDKIDSSKQVRCFAHVLNLAVKSFISYLKCSPLANLDNVKSFLPEEVEELFNNEDDPTIHSELIKKIRKFVVKIRLSNLKSESFEKICKDTYANRNPLKLKIDVRTRWNSSFAMLERLLLLKEAVSKITFADKELRQYSLSDVDWEMIEEIMEFLKLFDIATNQVVKTDVPTLAISIPTYEWLKYRIKEYIDEKFFIFYHA